MYENTIRPENYISTHNGSIIFAILAFLVVIFAVIVMILISGTIISDGGSELDLNHIPKSVGSKEREVYDGGRESDLNRLFEERTLRVGGDRSPKGVGSKGRGVYYEREVYYDHIEKVCLILGPYRNLTTLIVGVMALHPNIQVMNHGMKTLFDKKFDANFLADYSPNIFENFKQAAMARSTVMVKGILGGSILASHAYEPKYSLYKEYKSRYGNLLMKTNPTCLVWKESLRSLNIIRLLPKPKLDKLMHNPQLCFIMPIRNPLDTAISHLTSFDEHISLYGINPADATRIIILDAILKSISDVFKLQSEYGKDKVMIIFASDLTNSGDNILKYASEMERFMGIKSDKIWEESAQRNLVITKSKYNHDWSIIDFYLIQIKKLFGYDEPIYRKFYNYIPEFHRRKLEK